MGQEITDSPKLGHIKRVEKGWGYELWIANKPEYCGKLLKIYKDKMTSWHFHAIKDETMFVYNGSVKILWSFGDDIKKSNFIILNKGESFHIRIGMRHRIIALEDTDLFEFSTEHFDSDSIRIIKGD